MVETLEELTYDYEQDGTLVRKELGRCVLKQGGGWATVMFLFQELDPKRDVFKAPEIAVVRLKKTRGLYRKQSSFGIATAEQARQIMDALEAWYPRMATQNDVDGDADGDADGERDLDQAHGADPTNHL